MNYKQIERSTDLSKERSVLLAILEFISELHHR